MTKRHDHDGRKPDETAPPSLSPPRGPRRVSDIDMQQLVAESKELREDVIGLTTEVRELNSTLTGLVSKNDLQATLEDRMILIERKIQVAVDERDRGMRRENRRHRVRQKAIVHSQAWASIFFMLLTVLFASTIIDIHTHRAHIGPIEDRLQGIEQLINEVNDTIADGRIPEIASDRFETSYLPPLQPAPEQFADPAGLWLLILTIVGLVVSSLMWLRSKSVLMRTGHSNAARALLEDADDQLDIDAEE